jgi:hypothetical protein
MPQENKAEGRASSHTLVSEPAPPRGKIEDTATDIMPELACINHLPRPEYGLDIYEPERSLLPASGQRSRNDPRVLRGGLKSLESTVKKDRIRKPRVGSAAWLVAIACDAYLRSQRTFGHLPVFRKYSSRPQLMHHTAETVMRYMEFANPGLPVLWFIPEAIQVSDLVGLGMEGGWWQKDPDFPHIPTTDPYGDAQRRSDEPELVTSAAPRGGYFVLWQPKLLRCSSHANRQQQMWLLSQMAHELGLPESEILMGDLADQAVLSVQAIAEGLIDNRSFWAVRTSTALRRNLLYEDYFRSTDVACCLGSGLQGLDIMDYGNTACITRLGISPLVI